MRKDADRNNKALTHLRAEGEQWKRNVIGFLKNHKAESDHNFIMGYCIHILTDIFWNETLYIEFLSRYGTDPEPVQDEKTAYYNDTDQLDFELYKSFDWRPRVWELLEKSTSRDVDDILSAEEVDAWKKRTLHWYDSGASQHKNPIKYISVEDLLEFAKTASKDIRSFLKKEGL